jgi:hypothetical protein
MSKLAIIGKLEISPGHLDRVLPLLMARRAHLVRNVVVDAADDLGGFVVFGTSACGHHSLERKGRRHDHARDSRKTKSGHLISGFRPARTMPGCYLKRCSARPRTPTSSAKRAPSSGWAPMCSAVIVKRAEVT